MSWTKIERNSQHLTSSVGDERGDEGDADFGYSDQYAADSKGCCRLFVSFQSVSQMSGT